MNTETLLAEIRDQNLGYLMLAQKLLRQDRDEGMFRLGVDEDVADLIVNMTTSQMLHISNTNILICQMRNAEESIWKLLTSHSRTAGIGAAASRLHASILMMRAEPEVA